MSDPQGTVRAVTGEMQPWSDYTAGPGPVTGQVLAAWLADVFRSSGRILVAGPHDVALIRALVPGAASVTVLLRSPSDAHEVADQLADDGVQVIAGTLDGLAHEDGEAQFDAVIALDGLDRLLSTDSPAMTWTARWDTLARLAHEQAPILLGMTNEFSVAALLDARPPRERHGDEEWRPLHSDRTRPVSPEQLQADVQTSGRPVRGLWAAFGAAQSASLLATPAVLAPAAPGHLTVDLVADAVRATPRPLLAQPDEAVDSAARAGRTVAMADGWLVVAGGPELTAHELYAAVAAGAVVVHADRRGHDDDAEWSVAPASTRAATSTGTSAGASTGASAGASTTPAEQAGVVADASAVPTTIPDTVSAHAQLVALAEAEDVPGFRALAARIGAWVRDLPVAERHVVTLESVQVTSTDLHLGLSALRHAAPTGPAESLAAAWFRFQDRLLADSRRHPWPPWLVGEDLVATWLGMSGFDDAGAAIARGRELADDIARHDVSRGEAPDVRSALASAEQARVELAEARGQIFGLERTIGFRDKQLRVREERIRALREQLLGVDRLKGSPAYTLLRRAALVRHPRKFAGKVKRRLAVEVRKRR